MSERLQQPAPNLGSDQPAIDEDVLATLQQGVSEEMMPEVIIAFSSELDQRVNAVAQALSNGDGRAAGRHAHVLKGTAATLGASGILAIAAEIEQAGHSDDLAAQHRRLDQLRHQALLVTDVLCRRYPSPSPRSQ